MPYFEAGPYRWWWRNRQSQWRDLGTVEEAPRLRISQTGEEVRGDNMGDTIQDIIFRGYNVYLDIVFLEWNIANIWPMWLYRHGQVSDLNNAWSRMANLGCTARSASFELRAVRLGTCPPNGGALWYFPYVVLAPGFDLEFVLGTRLRTLPLQYLVLPYEASTSGSGDYRFYDVMLNADTGH